METLASTLEQRRSAQATTAELMWAAVDVGWLHREIAAALDMYPQTVQKRVAKARHRFPGGRALPQVAPPATPRFQDLRRVPVSERDWLSLTEAAHYTGRCTRTIINWYEAQLLPNTDTTTWSTRLFLRSDLTRLTTGPRRSQGIDYNRARLAATEALRPVEDLAAADPEQRNATTHTS